jgi:hypothetical protein
MTTLFHTIARSRTKTTTGRLLNATRSAQGQGVFELVTGMLVFTLMTVIMGCISIYLMVEHAAISGAREGARLASLSSNVSNDTSAIVARVKSVVQASCGQILPNSSITVTPPDSAATPGNRSVTVAIAYDMPTPLNASALAAAWTPPADPTKPPPATVGATVPVVAKATMRYEE